ncbi:MAG: hypothetical protein WCW36_00115 [Candidatus Paceibacterota bacterium]
MTGTHQDVPCKHKLLLPFFLTKEIAEEAMRMALTSALSEDFKRHLRHPNEPQFHIVMLVSALEAKAMACYPNLPLYPHTLAEYSYGDRGKWRYDFRQIARCKTLQLWQERNNGGTDSSAHLLFPGDTPFWGGILREGIAVGCSGDKPWIDRMIAGITSDIAIALAHDAKVEWIEANPDACFLPE